MFQPQFSTSSEMSEADQPSDQKINDQDLSNPVVVWTLYCLAASSSHCAVEASKTKSGVAASIPGEERKTREEPRDGVRGTEERAQTSSAVVRRRRPGHYSAPCSYSGIGEVY